MFKQARFEPSRISLKDSPGSPRGLASVADITTFVLKHQFMLFSSHHSILSRSRRLIYLLRTIGLGQTLELAASLVEDRLLRVFDRRYGVRTSGFIRLDQTSFVTKRPAPSTAYYGPVNAWALRK